MKVVIATIILSFGLGVFSAAHVLAAGAQRDTAQGPHYLTVER